MNNKLLEDAVAAGFCTDEKGNIWVNSPRSVHFCCQNELAKFAELQIPNGYKLVPTEPTDEMADAAWEAYFYSNKPALFNMLRDGLKAAISASPPINTEGVN